MPGCMCRNFTRNHGTPFVFLSMMKKNNKSSQQHWINVCGSRDASWHARESRNEHVWINVFICLCCYCMFMYNFIYNSLTTSSNAAYTLSSCTHSCGIWQQSHNAFSSSGSTLQMHARKKTQFLSLQKKKVVVVQKRYPKDISTTQGCELRDRVVLWNECLGELLTKTPLYPSLEKWQHGELPWETSILPMAHAHCQCAKLRVILFRSRPKAMNVCEQSS